MASLSASGLVPISAAIAGNEVAMTVESMFSMNRATATISGTIRFGDMMGGIWAPGVGFSEGKLRRHVNAFPAKGKPIEMESPAWRIVRRPVQPHMSAALGACAGSGQGPGGNSLISVN